MIKIYKIKLKIIKNKEEVPIKCKETYELLEQDNNNNINYNNDELKAKIILVKEQ